MREREFKPLQRMAYEHIKKLIMENALEYGRIYSESKIALEIHISRTPVRDALRMLQEQGFVLTVPYKGIYVTLLSLSNIKQMIYMRVAVETMVLRDFMEQAATPLVLEDIRYVIRKQQAIILEADFKPEQFYRLDAQMHAIWFEVMKKQKLWEILQAQQLHYTRFRMLDFETETDFPRIIKEHKRIFDLIEAKDISRMEEALKDHLYYSMKRMRYQIDVEYRDYFEEEEEEGKFDI